MTEFSFALLLPCSRGDGIFLNFDVFCSTSDQQCNRFVLLLLEVLLYTLCNWCLLVGFFVFFSYGVRLI